MLEIFTRTAQSRTAVFLKAAVLCLGLSFSLIGYSQGFSDLVRGAVSKIAGPNAADAL